MKTNPDINLGLELLTIARKEGEAFTAFDISCWCDCSEQRIQQIERRALEKLRKALEQFEISMDDSPQAPDDGKDDLRPALRRLPS
jgi:hypothetical protein